MRRNNPLTVTDKQRAVRVSNKVNFVANMYPLDFLRLTTRDTVHVAHFIGEAKPLSEYNRFSENGEILVAPTLIIDIATGKVTAHEGRHRAAAVLNAHEIVMPVGIQLVEDYRGDRGYSFADCPEIVYGEFDEKPYFRDTIFPEILEDAVARLRR